MGGRKLIKFGKSAFCMTLPQAWIKKNKLQKGHVLNVEETMHNSLEIFPGELKREATSKITILITDKSIDEIVDVFLAAYLNGYSIIELRGPNAGKMADIRSSINEFIAAEIMEVTSQEIIIHVFWDAETIDLDSIINRMGHIIRSMLFESEELISGNVALEDIKEKEREIKRQVLLARRFINYALTHSFTAQKCGLAPVHTLYTSHIVYFYGVSAEYVSKIANILADSDTNELDEPERQKLKSLIEQVASYFTKSTELYKQKNDGSRISMSNYEVIEDTIKKYNTLQERAWVAIFVEYAFLLLMKIKEIEIMTVSIKNAIE